MFIFTCEQLSVSSMVLFKDQQQCSWLSQKACGQMPNFKSDIQLAPISMTPATAPVNKPTKSTHNHPDQASWAPSIRFQMESCFFLTMYRCRIRSLAISLCQSIVWKSSYWPIPGMSPDSEMAISLKKNKNKKHIQIFEKLWDRNSKLEITKKIDRLDSYLNIFTVCPLVIFRIFSINLNGLIFLCFAFFSWAYDF